MIKIKIDGLQILQESTVEKIFQLEAIDQGWVWINREIFFDLISNVAHYAEEEEAELYRWVQITKEEDFLRIIQDKMKEKGWLEINQRLFAEIQEGFNPTEDIKTYVFASKKYFSQKLIAKLKELQWILKAMAVDAFQHNIVSVKTLEETYKEHFEDNSQIIEEILTRGEYQLGQGAWEYNNKNNALTFYKTGKRQRQWAEGNANFIFYDLNK